MANLKTTQYVTSVTDLENGDLIDVSKDVGGFGTTYESQKMTQTVLRSTLGVNGTNKYFPIYNGTKIVQSVIYQSSTTAIGIFGVTTPTFSIELDGGSPRTFGLARHTTANTAGNIFAIWAGGATSGATDKNGGALQLNGGVATGSGSSSIQFLTATAGGAGTTDRSPNLKATITGAGALNFESGGFISIGGDKYLHYTHSTLTYITSYNTYLGYSSGTLNSTGKYNTGIGSTSLSAVTTGEGNTTLGYLAGSSIQTSNYSTIIGYNAGVSAIGESNTIVGQGAGSGFTSGTFNAYFGRWAGLGAVSGNSYNTMSGYNSGASQQGSYNAGFGSGTFNGSGNNGSYNCAFGYNAGQYIRTTSQYNIYIGAKSGQVSGAGPWDYAFAIGANSIISASNTGSFGGNADVSKISTFYFGNAGLYTSAMGTVSQSTISVMPGGTYYDGGSGEGANMGGHNFAICSGLATGDGTAGSGKGNLLLQTTSVGASGSTLGTATTRVTILGATGYVGMQSISAPTAFLHLAASTTAAASLCIPSGTAPSSPVNGDLWSDGSDLKVRLGGVTYTLTKV